MPLVPWLSFTCLPHSEPPPITFLPAPPALPSPPHWLSSALASLPSPPPLSEGLASLPAITRLLLFCSCLSILHSSFLSHLSLSFPHLPRPGYHSMASSPFSLFPRFTRDSLGRVQGLTATEPNPCLSQERHQAQEETPHFPLGFLQNMGSRAQPTLPQSQPSLQRTAALRTRSHAQDWAYPPHLR